MVVACNTSTAHALRALQEAAVVPVIGVIKPGARAAIAAGGADASGSSGRPARSPATRTHGRSAPSRPACR